MLGLNTQLPTAAWQPAKASWDWTQGGRVSWQVWHINYVHVFDEKIRDRVSALCLLLTYRFSPLLYHFTYRQKGERELTPHGTYLM